MGESEKQATPPDGTEPGPRTRRWLLKALADGTSLAAVLLALPKQADAAPNTNCAPYQCAPGAGCNPITCPPIVQP